MKVRLNLPDAAIAAQAGWSEKSVTEMVRTYAHAVGERRLDEIDAAFKTTLRRQPPRFRTGSGCEPVRPITRNPASAGFVR